MKQKKGRKKNEKTKVEEKVMGQKPLYDIFHMWCSHAHSDKSESIIIVSNLDYLYI